MIYWNDWRYVHYGIDKCYELLWYNKYFLVIIDLHRGPIQSSYLFVLSMDELTFSIQENVAWYKSFVDDKVLIHKKTKLNTKSNYVEKL